jgi:hypothetical protein
LVRITEIVVLSPGTSLARLAVTNTRTSGPESRIPQAQGSHASKGRSSFGTRISLDAAI